MFVFVVMLFCLGGTLVYTMISVQKQFKSAQQKNADSIADGLAVTCELPLAVGDSEELKRLADRFVSEGPIVFVAVFNSAGELISHYCKSENMWEIYKKSGSSDEYTIGESPVFIVSSEDAADSKKENIGRVVVGISNASMKNALSSQLVGIVLVFLAAILVGSLVIFLSVGLWMKRLDKVLEACEAVSVGRFDQEFPDSGDDEIGRLVDAFDNMQRAIRQRDQELRKFNDKLQNQVVERTRELEKAKDRAVQTAEMLETKNRELQEFAYIASHDLQEPLRKITAFGQRLESKFGDMLEGRGRDYLDRMQNAANRMQGLITGLLSYSRVATKAKPFEKTLLSDIINGVLQDLEILINETGADIQTDDLGELEGDALQLRQLFQNLISNAVKFRKDEGTPEIRIRSRRDEEKNVIHITVADNGIGFEQKFADKIFTIFQRLHGRNEYEGSGIGLSICRRIVERHGGSIEALSEPGKGTTFAIKLPILHGSANREMNDVA